MTAITAEVSTGSPNAVKTLSAAIVAQAPPSAQQAVPPYEFDGQIEDPMDYSPVKLGGLAAPDLQGEEWPDGTGPLGF